MAETKSTKKNNIKPDLVLSMDDKVYLAVANNISESKSGKSLVYALVCAYMGRESDFDNSIEIGSEKDDAVYCPIPVKEMYAFHNADNAKLYYEAILQISAVQSNDVALKKLFKKNSKIIERFENSK